MENPIKILVVDDSAVVRDFLVYILSSEPDMHVVGTAKNGKEAILLAEKKKPDVITMDIQMPVMNGMDATKHIMSTKPVPIVLVTSSYDPSEVEKTFEAMDAGALAILAKPSGFNSPDFEKNKKVLVDTVRTMSGVKVVTRHRKYQKSYSLPIEKKAPNTYSEEKTKYKLIAIGVSTGGPPVLNALFQMLPDNLQIPIVVVQHIPEGFLEGMVEWLNQSSKLPVKIASQGEKLEPGKIYFCPAEFHMGITKNLTVELKSEIPLSKIRPSVSYLFRTVGKHLMQEAVGVLMTGMGKDGAEELAMMKENGAVTIVQDEKSSVVWGMPGEAVKLGAHKYILTPEEIAQKLIELNK